MPIIISFKHSVDPRDKVIVQGASSDAFFERNDKGRIPVIYMSGHDGEIFKDMIRNVEVIPDAEWDKNVEDQKKAQEAQQKKQADDLAAQEKHRADVATQQAQAKADDEKRKTEARKPWNRAKRLFRGKP
jgi:hypothetical protein